MERHRKANAFPDLGTPGDPRLLAAIERRTPGIAGGTGSINHFFGGVVMTPKKTRKGGGAASTYIPWRPSFFTEGTSAAPVYKCRINLGTVNNVPADNWNAAYTLSMGADDFSFIVLTITTGSGKVTTAHISIDSEPPTEDTIASGTPPVTLKIVLGAIGRTSAKMIADHNLAILATEVFRESKSAPTTGQEPFTRWWRWTSQHLA